MTPPLVHRTARRLSPGRAFPQGATLTSEGVNFALYSQHARGVWLLLYDSADGPPTDVIRLETCTKRIWHTFVHDLRAGQLYGYRVQGDFVPEAGLRFNEHKLLLDPYAKAFHSKVHNRDNLLLAYDPLSPERDRSFDCRDSEAVTPKCIVIDDDFDWQDDAPPDVPLERSFLYEIHLKGFSAHPSGGVRCPGTYLGFIEKIGHLKELGITAVELLPCHEFVVEDFLHAKGLTNYWGYNTIGFFAPESSYRYDPEPGSQVREFKTLVRELHRAGIEVLLDVVYNHSAEGNELGPTLSLRGIDNPTYYALAGPPDQPGRYYMNWTGCGNSLNLDHPQVIRLVMDSLRYWVQTMHVDGFRFDLASVLGRQGGGFQRSAAFFDAVAQDPVLARIKLIAEPWDIGTYEVGNFPVDWSEWNGRFRDTLRRFIKGDAGQLRELGWRLTGSADLYADDGRSAYNSINFITCHDGFTLYDLTAYNQKHNEANGENNRDGTDDNNSWNCGLEGPTGDQGVVGLRRRLARNHLCGLLFSLGTPMLLGGDEFLRSQRGNNNAYCQDNEISWFDWNERRRNEDFLAFTRRLIALNKRCTILHRRKFTYGTDCDSDAVPDIAWFGPAGGPPAWDDPQARVLCYQLDGSEEPSELGDYRLFLVFNADQHLQRIRLPALTEPLRWRRLVDTSLPAGQDAVDIEQAVPLRPQDHYLANPRSTVVLIGR